jgi:hypothetical protein
MNTEVMAAWQPGAGGGDDHLHPGQAAGGGDRRNAERAFLPVADIEP